MKTIVMLCLGLALAGCGLAKSSDPNELTADVLKRPIARPGTAPGIRLFGPNGMFEREVTQEEYDRARGLEPETVKAAKAEASCRAIGLDEAGERWADCLIVMMAAEQRSEDARRAGSTTGGGSRATQGGGQGMSFMCKDAISRGDSGAMFIFC